MTNIKISGNVEKEFYISYVPYMYSIDIDKKHGYITFTKRKNKIEIVI